MPTTMTPASSRPKKELTGRHVLYWMVGFFAIMFVVNGIFLFHAITSFPGEDVKKSYLQGLTYNQTLDARARQVDLGWQAEIGVTDGTLILQLDDKYDVPVSGHEVIGSLRRPATQRADISLHFNAGRNGVYTADTGAIEPGRWDVRLNVSDPDTGQIVFSARKTIIVR